MARTRDDFGRLISELEADFSALEELARINIRAFERIGVGAVDSLDYAALAFTIHNIYGVVENYCLRVAKFFENGLDPAAWHKELLGRMTLAVEDVRPALFSNSDLSVLDELRAFRHTFRHLYSRPLNPEKTLAVQAVAVEALGIMNKAHTRFIAVLREFRSAL